MDTDQTDERRVETCPPSALRPTDVGLPVTVRIGTQAEFRGYLGAYQHTIRWIDVTTASDRARQSVPGYVETHFSVSGVEITDTQASPLTFVEFHEGRTR